MLCLTRTPDTAIHVGDNVIVHVFSVKGQQVRLGVEAPIDQPILRSELYHELKPEKVARTSKGISALVADDLRLMLRKYLEGTVTQMQLFDSFQAALK